MINYTDLTSYLVEVAQRNPNVQFVKFDTDIDAFNDAEFVCPAFIISPTQTTLNRNSFVQYGFQLLYLDKLNQEEDNYSEVLESALHYIIGYISVVDIDYKIEMGISIDPVIVGYDGGVMIGQQANITIEDQYNLDKYKSPFYA